MPESSDIARANVLGVGVHALDVDEAVRRSEQLLASGGRGYICVTGVHGVMEAQSDHGLRSILNRAFLCIPDGMPTVWVGRLQGYQQMRRVYGPDFMMELCWRSQVNGYRHFLFGGAPGVAEQLKARLEWRMPWLRIVGTYTPPYGRMSANQEAELVMSVRRSRPDILWVGLSTPKQERFMAEYWERLDLKLMVGVGAAFDIHAGLKSDAPEWMKRFGLQWLHRLAQEPCRLAPRYLKHNPRFLWAICRQFALGNQPC